MAGGLKLESKFNTILSLRNLEVEVSREVETLKIQEKDFTILEKNFRKLEGTIALEHRYRG